MNNEKLNFRHPFPCYFVLFLSSHTLLKHRYQLSVWLVCASAAGCRTVITHWKGIAISGSGTRVTVMGAKYVTTACGNEDSMGEETDFTSEMKSSEKTLSVLLQHISDTLFHLSCLQKIQYRTITFWKNDEKKWLQIVWLRIRVQKAITKPKELRFGYKMVEFWEPKLRGPLCSLWWQWT